MNALNFVFYAPCHGLELAAVEREGTRGKAPEGGRGGRGGRCGQRMQTPACTLSLSDSRCFSKSNSVRHSLFSLDF